MIMKLMENTRDDPKYNGEHTCPRCGSASGWKAHGKETSFMIVIECAGPCRGYVMSYQQIRTLPYFK
jgi:hypothetical protein